MHAFLLIALSLNHNYQGPENGVFQTQPSRKGYTITKKTHRGSPGVLPSALGQTSIRAHGAKGLVKVLPLKPAEGHFLRWNEMALNI